MVQTSPGDATRIHRLAKEIEDRLIGRTPLIARVLIGALTGGHVLVEGAPGLAKTRAARLMAAGLGGAFQRVQCTPDLMPSDLTGTPVYRAETGDFEFRPGPIFTNMLLVDEINRAPPKVQSALLEAMAERQATIGGETRPLPDPFLVIATQNPIEHEGVFPLPEAQLDRFQTHVIVAQPDLEEERAILELVEGEENAPAPPPPTASLDDLRAARAEVRCVHLAPALKDQIVRLVTATRDPSRAPEIEHAVSPRGSIALAAGARARAWLAGRDYATPEDIIDLAPDTLAHRMVLTWRAVADGSEPRAVIARLLAEIEPL